MKKKAAFGETGSESPKLSIVFANINLLILILLLAITAFYIATIRPGHDWSGDNCQYVLHAQNLLNGKDYRQTGVIANPHSSIIPASYPPIYPLLLTPVIGIFGNDLQAIKIENILFFIAALALLAAYLKGRIAPALLLASVAAIGFNPVFWDYKDMALSEFSFFLFLCLAFAVLDGSSGVFLKLRKSAFYPIIAGVLIYFSYGTRSIGFLLIPAFILYDFMRFRKPLRFYGQVVAVFAGLVFLQNIFLHSDFTHIQRKASGLSWNQIIDNFFSGYPTIFTSFWMNPRSKLLTDTTAWALAIFCFAGLARRFYEKKYTLLDTFTILYLLFFLNIKLTDTNTPQRYLIPVIPFYVLWIFEGFSAFSFLKKLWVKTTVVGIILGLIFFGYAEVYKYPGFMEMPKGIEEVEAKNIYDFIKKNTNPDDIVASREPRVTALYAGRPSAHYITDKDTQVPLDEKIKYFRSVHAKYWFTDSDISQVNSQRLGLEKIFSSGKYSVYALQHDS